MDIAKCTSCKKLIPDGCKILPDPDYKAPETDKKLITSVGTDASLRNIRYGFT